MHEQKNVIMLLDYFRRYVIMTRLEWDLQELFNDNQSFYDEIENIRQLLKDIEQYKNVNDEECIKIY